MTTVLDIATSALQRIQVTAIGEEPAGEDMTAAVRELNFMLSNWASEGIDLEMTALDGGDDLTSATKYDDAIMLNLALRLASLYQRPAQFMNDADRAWRVLRADFYVPTIPALDNTLLNMPSQLGRVVTSVA